MPQSPRIHSPIDISAQSSPPAFPGDSELTEFARGYFDLRRNGLFWHYGREL
jgi:hypothetical protein